MSKLSVLASGLARPRILTALLLFQVIALLSGVSVLKAQTADAEKADGAIAGTVYAPDNQPAAQVAVTVKSHEAGIFRSVLTDYDGHFRVTGLARGAYEIRVEEAGYEPLHAAAQLEGPAQKVELHLVPSMAQQARNYTISVRELSIPGKAHEEFDRGLESMGKKDFPASLNHFAKAIQKFPGYFEAFYHQGVVQTSLGQLEKAMQAFEKCIELSGGRYARADFGMGYLLYLEDKPNEAENVIRKGLEQDANSADGFVVLGMTLLKLNRPDEAEKSAREALLRNPSLANAYLVLADSFARRKNYAEQIQDLDSYLKLQPNGELAQRVVQARELAVGFLSRTQPKN